MNNEEKEVERLVAIAEDYLTDGHTAAMNKLQTINPTYHWCHEWDGMVICDKDPEWSACLCNANRFKT